MRSVCFNELTIDQKKVYCVRRSSSIFADIKRFLSCRRNKLEFMAEFSIIILHPNLLSKDWKFPLFNTYDEINLIHDFNDVLCLCSLFRIYLVMRAIINITEYATPRAARLCMYNRV